MTNERSGPPQAVPTLTEVVTWPDAGPEPGSEPVREPPLAPQPEPVREPPAEPEPAPARDPPPVVPETSSVLAPAHAEPPPAPVRASAAEPAPAGLTAARLPLTEEQLTQRILLDLQRQVDLVLEFRVREVLTPILTRATDALVREARAELSRSLRDVVARSVAQELRRQRSD